MSNQFVVTGTIKPTRVNTEILTFSFNLGPLKVVCIANIPEEGQITAPVYVKLELPGMQASQSNGSRRSNGHHESNVQQSDEQSSEEDIP